MAKLSDLAPSILKNQEDKHTVELFGETFPFKITLHGLRRLQREGREHFDEEIDPIQAFFGIMESSPNVDTEALKKKKVDELRSEAKELGVEGYSDMRKADLVKAVVEAQAQVVTLKTKHVVDVMALTYAGLVNFDPSLKLETVDRLFSFGDMRKMMPVIGEDMNQIMSDQNASSVDDKSDGEGKG